MARNDDRAAPDRLGVLGGTFDPIHLGHIAVARAVIAAHSLPRVLLVPSARPPHKLGEVAGAEDRLAMVRIAAACDPRLVASDLEIRRGGISFTVDTLASLKETHAGAELFFIAGEDSIPEMPFWKDSSRIFRLARIVAVNRPGPRHRFEPRLFPEVPPEILERCERDRVDMEPVPIASREIRQAIASGQPFDAWLPPGVGDHIRRRGLYGHRGEIREFPQSRTMET